MTTQQRAVIDTVRMLEFVLNCMELDDIELAKATLKKEITKRKEFIQKSAPQLANRNSTPAVHFSGKGAQPPPPVPKRSQRTTFYESIVIEDDEKKNDNQKPKIGIQQPSRAPSTPTVISYSNIFTQSDEQNQSTPSAPTKTLMKARNRGSVINLADINDPNTSPLVPKAVIQQAEENVQKLNKAINKPEEKRGSVIQVNTNVNTPQEHKTTITTPQPISKKDDGNTKDDTTTELSSGVTPTQNTPKTGGRTEKQQKNYDMIVSEILQTEKDYVRDLQIVTDVSNFFILQINL